MQKMQKGIGKKFADAFLFNWLMNKRKYVVAVHANAACCV